MSEKNLFLVAYLLRDNKEKRIRLHGGWRHPKKGYHVEFAFADNESVRGSISVWELTFPNRETADQLFLAFFEITTEEAVKIDRRRKVLRSSDDALKFKKTALAA